MSCDNFDVITLILAYNQVVTIIWSWSIMETSWKICRVAVEFFLVKENMLSEGKHAHLMLISSTYAE